MASPDEVEVEVTRASRPVWRPLMLVGWVLFTVSFFLPALSYSCEVPPPPPPPSPDSIILEPPPPSPAPAESAGISPSPEGATVSRDVMPGWRAFTWALGAGPFGVLSAATNLLVLVTVILAYGNRLGFGRWPTLALSGATVFNAVFWSSWVVNDEDLELRLGYYVWVASFACVAAALWLRAREGADSGA